MIDSDIAPEQAAAITAYVDIEAPPPDDLPTAHFVFGTNQLDVVVPLLTDRHQRGLAPLIIVTGGMNRHTQIIEGTEFQRALTANGIPAEAIRVEETSANTWQNVEYSTQHLDEALQTGLKITAISKWFHRRTVHALKAHAPDLGGFFALGWEPLYDGEPVTRNNWLTNPNGKRRVLREWDEVSRRTATNEIVQVTRANGSWT